MLFMGTKKFPDENEWESWLASHGGGSNASTDAEYTTFYFDVPSPYLIPAMERFAEFFISPLFKSDCVERELKAVHSEFVDSKMADYHRRCDLLSVTAKPNHPFAKFGWSVRSFG